MAGQPKVTVVLPVYNGERHLAEAVDSILNQTFRDFEAIVVDDGSTDRSPAILESYAQRDPRLIVSRHPTNLGITAALNAGCRLARGSLIAIANQDDICMPVRLQRQVEFLDEHPEISMVGSWAEVVNDEGQFLHVKKYLSDPAVATWSMIFLSSILHPAATIRRDTLQAIGFYPSGYGGGSEDYAMGVRVARVGRVCSLPQALVKYRLHPGNFTKQRWTEQEAEANRIVAEGVEYVLGTPIPHGLAAHLRGLSTNQYPQDPVTVRQLGHLIDQLHAVFVQSASFNERELRGVHHNAAVKLWLLAALAARRDPGLSFSFAARATSIAHLSFAGFAAKVAATLAQRITRRARSRR